jgi:S1-C subfamily serine protease
MITAHTIVHDDGTNSQLDNYVIVYGSEVLKVQYAESQISTVKPGASLLEQVAPGKNLHWHARYGRWPQEPDVSQVPHIRVPIRACEMNSKYPDTDGHPVIAIQSVSAPCMSRTGDNTLHYLLAPNGGIKMWEYVNFDILEETSNAVVVAAQSAPPRRDIPAIAKAANGAIVSIIMSDKDGKPIALGSGFLISNDGAILTNYHVIAEGSSAVVKFPDGTFYVVDGVLASNRARDVAVIKVHGENFRALTLGNSDQLQVGEEVVAIGNPLSLESTVSSGIVSGIRTIENEGGKYLQISAPISPGSSGGPLFNMAGEVIGITTMYLKGGENLNFAIPINDAKPLLLPKSSKIQALPNETEPVKAQTQTAAHDGTIRVETQMAFVWGQDGTNGAVSSYTTDPLTGKNVETLSYRGIAVTLSVRYFDCPWMGWCHTESYLTFTNHSGNDITVRYGDTVLTGGKAMRLKQACVDCRETKAKDNPKNLDLLTAGHTIRDRTSYMVSLAFDWPNSTVRQSFLIDGHDFVFLIPPVGGSL